MKSTNRLRAVVASAAALATIAAGLALVTASPALATHQATDLTIVPVYPTDLSASAGTCQIYRAIPTNFNGQTSDPENVDITLAESPTSDAQDVDFCRPPIAPDAQRGDEVASATYDTEAGGSYMLGRSVTNKDNSAGGAPDESRTTPNNTFPTQFNSSGTDYASVNTDGGFVEFGVAALVPGTFTINAVLDRPGGDSTGDKAARPLSVTATAGGLPQSTPAYNAVTEITSERTTYSAVQGPPNTPAAIDLMLANPNKDTVFGVNPSFRVRSGPNASDTIRTCGESNDFGRSACPYTGTVTGTDTLLVWVNHSAAPNAVATAGPDPGEPTIEIVVNTFAQSAVAPSARFIDLTPNSPATQEAGKSATYTATITDGNSAPVQAAEVTFSETGPGRISGGTSSDGVTSTRVLQTGPDGRVQIANVALIGESGTQTISARLSGVSQCATVINGVQGVCSDSTTNTISASPSASPSASSTATPTRSATPTATATATRSATSTATTSASSSAPPGCQTAGVVVNTPTINATGLASVTVFGATPNSRVELQGYSQDHFGGQSFANDPTPVDRAGTSDSSGTITFNDLRPSSNTRLRARQVGCAYGDSAVVNVRTTIFLKVTRTGARTYLFDVDSVPARPGGLIVSLYRITGQTCAAGVEPRNCPGEVFISQTRVSAIDGSGTRTLKFDASFGGREQFVLKTGRDAQSAPGRSNVRDLSIF